MHAVVTGASSGIGEAIAKALSRQGYAVTLVARRGAQLERVKALLGPDARAHVLPRDLGDLDGLASVLADARAAHGPIDLLVNNAGAQIVAPTASVPIERGEQILRLDLLSPLRLTQLVLPEMIARKSGAIVDVASLAGLVPLPGSVHYSAAKAGLAAASEALRAEVKPHGVHVLTVYPGPVYTAMADAAMKQFGNEGAAGRIPWGDADVLADRIVSALKRRSPRVIYPRAYNLARLFPAIARIATDCFSPPPKALAP